jgi:hypothetical protein
MATIATLDHSNLQAEAFALTFAFPVLATLTIGLRMYSRSLTGTFGMNTAYKLRFSFGPILSLHTSVSLRFYAHQTLKTDNSKSSG